MKKSRIFAAANERKSGVFFKILQAVFSRKGWGYA